jgi:alkyl hydroperoxide reductase subunit D
MQTEAMIRAYGPHAKDIMLNVQSILSEEGAPGLTSTQQYGIALSSAYAARHAPLVSTLLEDGAPHLSSASIEAAKSAATIMAMNNIYYRFAHVIKDTRYLAMPAKLRMNVIANPGVEKVEFELYALAVSAINGCAMCMDSHVGIVERAGVTAEGIQSCIRIAAVMHAVAVAGSIAS